jgi:UDP-2-acetamido-3-amino-2,3-dideoxy-glucuronate N-acetyltransferase
MKKIQIHKTAEVFAKKIGTGTIVWQNTVILKNAIIGKNCNINCNCFIENDVKIGNSTTIKSGTYLWDGVSVGNNVFIGPNVTFTNDKYPKSKKKPKFLLKTIIEDDVSVGAASILMPGIKLGRGSIIGAGSLVTKSVPSYVVVAGSPAKIINYINNIKKNKKISILPEKNLKYQKKDITIEKVSISNLKTVSDIRGDLSVGDFQGDIPFKVKRFFLISKVPNEKIRGEHAHYKCHQYIICTKGSCSITLDDGKKRFSLNLNSPSKGLYIPPKIWSIQYNYSPDASILVFASHKYDPKDYIRDYNIFLKTVYKKR